MLTDHEAICLEILQTDDLMAVGSHEGPIKALVAKGYASHKTGVWYTITEAGCSAFLAYESGQLGQMINEHNERIAPVIDGEFHEIDATDH